jgi:long-chain acyl-CoA synthetase
MALVAAKLADERPDEVALRDDDVALSWADVNDALNRVANGLRALKLGPSDRVAVFAENAAETVLAHLGGLLAGVSTVPGNFHLNADEMAYILQDSGTKVLFLGPQTFATGLEAAHQAGIPTIIAWRVPETPGVTPWEAWLAAADPGEPPIDVPPRPNLMYTSGTTGRPKGCELTHGNLLSDARNAVAGPLVSVLAEPGASTLLFLPLAHSFARIIQIGCLESGAVLGHYADTRTLAAGLAEFNPTFLLAVPRVFEKVFSTAQQQAAASSAKAKIFKAAVDTAEAWSRADGDAGRGPGLRLRHALYDRLVYARLRQAVGGQVRYAVSGGAPLGDRLGHFFRGVGIPVLEGYGLTETSAAATVNRPDRQRIGTVGQPLPGVSVRIAEDGEILLSGPTIFRGYWRNPEATAADRDQDGWLRTGDLGSLDEAGFLSVTGRKKELIVTAGGKNVAPAVLEDRIRAHPLVSQAMVVGDQKPYIACLITLDDEVFTKWKEQHGKPAGASPADLAGDPDLIAELQAAVDDANLAVSRAESIRRFTVLAADFTEASGHITPSLKVRRAQVTKDFADEIESLYS